MSEEINIPESWSQKYKDIALHDIEVAKRLGSSPRKIAKIVNRTAERQWEADRTSFRGWVMMMRAKFENLHATPFDRVQAEEPVYHDGKAAVEHGNDFYARHPRLMLKPKYR